MLEVHRVQLHYKDQTSVYTVGETLRHMDLTGMKESCKATQAGCIWGQNNDSSSLASKIKFGIENKT